MSNVKLSIRLMTYNHADFIEDALKGIDQQQTNFDFEVVIGDDFSSDNTLQLVKDYLFENPNITVNILERKRGGAYDKERQIRGRLYNFINIIDNCQGEYIALLDGDDYWTDPLKLQKQVDFLEAHEDFSLVFHNVNLKQERSNSNKLSKMHKDLQKTIFETKDILRQWFIPTCSIVFKKSKNFQIPNWFFHCISGDIPLLLLLSLDGKIKYINNVMGMYRLHNTGISVSHTGYHKALGMIYIYQNFNIYSNRKYSDEIDNAIKYELHTHLPEFKELKKLKKRESDFYFMKKIKKIFKSFKNSFEK